MSVSRETEEKLAAYADLLRKWNARINLIAPSTVDDLEHRHIEDCGQLAVLAPQTGSWLDMGSGGGLPGAIIAIYRPQLQVSLLESDKRKAEFLRAVARKLELKNVAVLAQRIEATEALKSDNISARALASLDRLMAYVDGHLAADGTAWFMKGKTWQSEVEEARKHWRFDLETFRSVTDPEAAILKVRKIRHV